MPKRLTLLLALAAGPALAEIPPLGREAEITEGLIATAIAYEIGDKCDGVDARWVRGISYLYSLRDRARALGYSREDIDAFIDDDAEKDRLEAIARQRLRDLGAVEGAWDTYCAVGRAEIAAGTPIGWLLSD